MSLTKSRRGVFRTHRGKQVIRASMAAGALSLAVMVTNGVLNGEDPQVAAQPAVDEFGAEAAKPVIPDIEPAVADPFAMVADAAVVTAPESGSDEGALYANAITVAGETTVAYASYSHDQVPEAYLDSIPSLTPEMRAAVGDASTENWPEIEATRTTVVSTIQGTQPMVLSFDPKKGQAVVSVTVAQDVTDARGEYTISVSYLVTLGLVEGDDQSGETWQVLTISK